MSESVKREYYEQAADINGYILFRKYGTYDTEMICPAHFHDSVEFTFVTKGKLKMHINDKEYELCSGDVCFTDRFDTHFYTAFPGNEHYVVIISTKYLDSTNGFDKNRVSTYLPQFSAFTEIKELLDYTFNKWNTANEAYRLGFVNMLLGIFSSCCDMYPREYRNDVHVMLKALEYIEQNYAEKITLDGLAGELGYSKNYFSMLFKKFTDMNLREYINRRRISEFEKIVSHDSSISTSATARMCGFDSLNTFYRAYNRYSKNKNRNF